MDEILKILRELDWSPLYISLKTGVVATIISFFLGIFAARKVVKAGPSEGHSRRDPDSSNGSAAHGGWLFPSAFIQPQTASWNLSL